MYKVIGKCLCGGTVVKPDVPENTRPKPKPQCMHCFNKPPKLKYDKR